MNSLVEYYRSRLEPLPVSTIPGWKLVRTTFGIVYQQEGTGLISPRALLELLAARAEVKP